MILSKQSTNTILMIRPLAFNYNMQTAINNHYQNANDFDSNSNQINLRAQTEFDNFVLKLRSFGVDVIVFQDDDKFDTPDKAMGLEPTRIAIASFIYGCIGFTVAILMMNYIMIEDWPMDIGGKPSFSYIENMPSFVPIMFELTVFFAAHLMVITFYLRSRMWPFKKAENPDKRTTDDHFLMEIDPSDKLKDLEKILKKSGAVEIKIIEKESH